MLLRIPFTNLVIGRKRATHAAFDDRWYGPVLGKTKAGVIVSDQDALKISTVLACVRRISSTIGSLPRHLYSVDGRNKEKATWTPLYRLLHSQPNPETTAAQWTEALIAHVLLFGNHYSHIQTDFNGQPSALWQLDPSRMTVKRSDTTNRLIYEYRMTANGEPRIFLDDEILHVAGISLNGIVGLSILSLARETMGLSVAEEEFSSRFFANGAFFGGTIETAGSVDEDGRKRIRREIQKAYGGVENTNLLAVLEQGLHFNPLTVKPLDAQFLEQRNFSVVELCRFFDCPPHLIFDWARATWGNSSQATLDYIKFCIVPHCTRMEQALTSKLLPNDGSLIIKHNLAGLLRGDDAARATYFKEALNPQTGWMTKNEVRELEDLNPMDGFDKIPDPVSPVAPINAERFSIETLKRESYSRGDK